MSVAAMDMPRGTGLAEANPQEPPIATPQHPPRRYLTIVLLAVVAIGLGFPRVGAAGRAPQQIAVPLVHEPKGVYKGRTRVQRRGPRRVPGTGTVGAGQLSSGSSTGSTVVPNTAPGAASPFVVTYNGFTPQAQAAFQYALDIWGSTIVSPVPIRVTANWRTDFPAYVLGAAGAAMMIRDFTNAPRPYTYYPAALANARAGRDLTAGEEIVANFNATFDWYLGTDGNAGNRFDFATVVLHEIGHGLGFLGSMRVENGNGLWGVGSVPALPLIYDSFMTSGNGRHLIDGNAYANGSPALATALTSNDVHFSGPTTIGVDRGSASIFAPNPWVPGGSIAHLNDALYPAGHPDSLMTPSISPGEVIHDPGPLTVAILADMGWQTTPAVAPPPAPPPPPPPAPPRPPRVTGLRVVR